MKGEGVDGKKDDDNGDDDKVSLENHCGTINKLSEESWSNYCSNHCPKTR